MNINELIHILENKILFLEQQKSVFHINGDLQKILELEKEIAETQVALQKLKS